MPECPAACGGEDSFSIFLIMAESKNIMFVNPSLGEDFSALDIGITALATYINARSRHKAAIGDLTFHRKHWKEHLRKEIEKKKPHVIGISCSSLYMKYVKMIVKEIKNKYGLPVVLGGYQASINPENTISADGADGLFIGDAEKSVVEFLDRLSSGEGFDGVPGLWFKNGDGTFLKNSGGSFHPDLNELPAPDFDLWDDLDLYLYFLGMLYVQGSRGCPYKCTFCDAHGIADSVEGKYFRLLDPVRYARDMSHYYELYRNRGLKLFQIFDPVFTINTKWINEFCEEYRRLGLHEKIGYSAFSRIDNLSEEKIKVLARSGCKLLRVGIETADDFVRQQVYGKIIQTEKIRKIVELAHAEGINFTAFFILGGPYETQRTFLKTIKFAWELDAARSAFFIYKPFTAEGVRQLAESGGGINADRLEEADNISFGGTTYGKAWGPRTVELYQMGAYFLTFGRRWLRTVRRRKHNYFIKFYEYMKKGLALGLDYKYLAMYFHIYGDDNFDR
jgi:radical SAM superfamily enzyme YgiQ (UPF0313 family)